MTKNRSRLLRRVALVAIGLAVGVGLAEFVARMVPRGVSRHYIESDPVLHHRLRRNLSRSVQGVPFTTNSLGLRDREYPPSKPEGVFRILMLGDSFTEGAGLPIEETVAKRAERLLNATCSGAYEVVNAGTGSYSPILEYLQLKRLGLALEPDLVVLNFDMTDVHDDYIRTLLATLDPDGLPLAVDPDRRREAALLMPPLPKAHLLSFLDPVEIRLNRSELYQEFRRSWIGKRLLGGLQLTPERLEAWGSSVTSATIRRSSPAVRTSRVWPRPGSSPHGTSSASGISRARAAPPSHWSCTRTPSRSAPRSLRPDVREWGWGRGCTTPSVRFRSSRTSAAVSDFR